MLYLTDANVDLNDVSTGETLASYDASMKNGYLFGAKVGWLTPFTNRIMAVELEYNYLHSTFDQAKDLGVIPYRFEHGW